MTSLPIVLLVHGMGTHPLENMSREFKAGLTEAAKGFNIDDFDIDEHLEIVEFNYSETLDNIRTKLAEQAQDIINQFDVLPGADSITAIVAKLLKYEANIDEDEFIYTHWLDVLLYGGAFYGEPIRIELSKKINSIKKRAGGRDVHIVAHSLGTAVTHDTLEKLYRAEGTVGDGIPDLKPGIDNIKCLWMFANVSRLVAILNGVTPSDTVVRSGPLGCTDYFYNARHALDPFTWFKTYAPEIDNGRNFVGHVVREKNTHSFHEYIADPEVARYMLLQMTGLQEPKSNHNFEQANTEHRGTAINGAYDKIEQATRGLRDSNVTSIYELFKAIKEFKEIVDDILEDEGGDDDESGDD